MWEDLASFFFVKSMQNEEFFHRNHWLSYLGLLFSLCLALGLLIKDWETILEWLSYVQDPERLEQVIRHPGVIDDLFLLLLTLLMSAVPFLSSSVIAVVNGVVLGSGIGFVINWLGIVLGNLLVAFLMGRLGLGHKEQRLSKHEELLSRFDSPFLALCIGYMIPLIPSFLVNGRAIRLKIPKKQMILAMMVGAMPSSLIYALGGNAIFHLNLTELATVAVALALILGGYMVLRYVKLRQKEKTS